MRVAVFSRFPEDTCSPRGGVETATLGLLRGLIAHGGIDLHVVTLEKHLKKLVIEEKEGMKIHRLPGSWCPMFIDVMAGPGRKRLRRYLTCQLKPDVVHFQETYGLGMGSLPIPKVFTIHGFDSLNVGAQKNRFWRLRSLIWGRVEAAGLKRQKHLISITPYVKKTIEGRTRAKIFDIDNAISVEYFHMQRNEVPGRVFFAGWLNPRKNAVGLIRAFAKVLESGIDAHLNIAGEAKDKPYYDEVVRTIQELGLTESVKLLGRIDQDALRRELSEAALFVLPSRQENAPMVIAEAMAVGVPVIASNVCGMPYMIKDGVTGILIDPDNIDEIASRMILLLTDTVRHNSIARAARLEAESRYHPEAVANKTVSVYKELLTLKKDGKKNKR